MESLFAPNYWKFNLHSQTGWQHPHPCQGHAVLNAKRIAIAVLLKQWTSLIGMMAFALTSNCSRAVGAPWCSAFRCWAWLFNDVLIGFESSSRGGEQERKELVHFLLYLFLL